VARSGIALGDVVLSVDGETVDARMKRFSAFLPASSPQAQHNAVATRLLRGPLGAPATLEIQDAEGRIKTVSLPRERGAAAGLRWFRSGPAYRLLADHVGYIDLEKLTIAMVDSAFDALAGARAIVFDARGYPQGTGMAIARRLARVPGTPAARLSRIVRRGPDTATAETYSFVQVVPDPVAERYQGPTAVIVDERTFSQGEHVALLLKAANPR
jgi:C-terminal processing protease CtpA/Prc